MNAAQRRRAAISPVETDDDPVFRSNDTAGISGSALRAFLERIERLQEEKAALQADIREVKSEAKVAGYDIKVINYLLKLRATAPDDLAEFEAMVGVYRRAIGMQF